MNTIRKTAPVTKRFSKGNVKFCERRASITFAQYHYSTNICETGINI